MKRLAVAGLALVSFWTFTTPAQAAGTVALVSHAPASATASPPAGSVAGPINAKGTKIAFSSEASATDLVASAPADTNGGEDAFLYNTATGNVSLVSHAAGDPSQAADDPSFLAGMSPSGRFVLIQSLATDLISGSNVGTDANYDLYVYDTKTKKASLVSHAVGDTKTDSDGFAQNGVISEKKVDRKLYPVVVWEADASNVTADFEDQNDTITVNLRDAYLYDGKTKKNTLITHDVTDPNKGSATCPDTDFCPVHSGFGIAGNGKYVTYTSPAHNLVAGYNDGNGDFADGSDIYVFNAKTKENTLVTRTAASPVAGGNGGSDSPSPTPNGRYISFRSAASDLPVGDGTYDNNTGNRDVFLYDQKTGTYELLSHKEGDLDDSGTGTAIGATLSDDGRYATFSVTKVNEFFPTGAGAVTDSNGTNFSTGLDVIQLDRTTGTTGTFTLVSRSAVTNGNAGNGHTFAASRASSDGRYVLISSAATDLVSSFGDNNATGHDLFIWDRQDNSMDVVSRDDENPAAGSNGTVFAGGLALKAPRVSFGTDGTNHVPGFVDGNAAGFDAYYYTLP